MLQRILQVSIRLPAEENDGEKKKLDAVLVYDGERSLARRLWTL